MQLRSFGVAVVAASLVALTGCGGTSSDGAGQGSLAFHAAWQPLDSAGSAPSAQSECGGFDSTTPIPAEVLFVRITFASNATTGDGVARCCVAIPRGETNFQDRRVVLTGLRPGSAAFTIDGFQGEAAPPNSVGGDLCPTGRADAVACTGTQGAPNFSSGAVDVTIVAGVITDASACVRPLAPPTVTPTSTSLPTSTFTLIPTNTRTTVPTNTPTTTATPTATLTNSPTVTPTPSDTPTTGPSGTPTETPTGTPSPSPTLTPTNVTIRIGSATGAAGSQVSLAVTLSTAGLDVFGTDQNIALNADAPIAATGSGTPDCTVNPDIQKDLTVFTFQPIGCTVGTDCQSVQAVVLGTPGTEVLTPIPDGAVLYTCNVNISANAMAGSVPLGCPRSEASAAPHGQMSQLITADCTNGEIIVQ